MTKLNRIQIAILAVTATAGVLTTAWQGAMWGVGALAGGLVAYLNFKWLRHTVERLLGEGSGKGRVAFVYSFKLAVVGGVLVGLVFGLKIPALSILIGIGAMPVGIIVEQAWSSLVSVPSEPDV